MAKYIDVDKLKKFIESIGLTSQKSADYNDGRDDVKRMVLDFIDSLQQEQPSFPSNLDEAAIQAHIRLEDGEGLSFLNAFKAGAEWMARQGSSFKVNVEEVPQGHWYAGLHLGGCAEEEK